MKKNFPILCGVCGLRGIIPAPSSAKTPWDYAGDYISVSKRQIERVASKSTIKRVEAVLWICPDHGEHLVFDWDSIPQDAVLAAHVELFEKFDKGHAKKIENATKVAEDAMANVISELKPKNEFDSVMNAIKNMDSFLIVITSNGAELVPANQVCLFTDANPPLMHMLPRHIKHVYNWSNVTSVEMLDPDDERCEPYHRKNFQDKLESKNA